MTVEHKRFCCTFSGNVLVAKATALKPNRPQHLHMQTETSFRIKSETGLDKWNTAPSVKECFGATQQTVATPTINSHSTKNYCVNNITKATDGYMCILCIHIHVYNIYIPI